MNTQTLHEQLTDSNKSAFARYQELALGTDSIWYLIKYELIILMFSWLPGAVGLVLRKFFYPFILGSVGKNVIFGQGVTLRHGLKIRLGDNVIVDDRVTLDAKGNTNTGITIGDNTIVSRNSILSCKDGNITVGSTCTIGINSLMHSLGGSDIIIGNDVLVAAYTYIMGSGRYGTDRIDLPFKKQGLHPQGGVRVSNNVWFGSGSQIMDGVTIGEGVIIGSSTIVNKDIPDYEMVAGIPMKSLRNRRDDST